MRLAKWLLSALVVSNISVFADTHSTQPVFDFAVENNSDYGELIHTEFANIWSQNNAGAFMLDIGSEQVRLGVDWAHRLDDHQRFKIGLEHFAQQIDFNFASGTDHEFVGQNAIGADYQYQFTASVLHSLDAGAYYIEAQNADFDKNLPVTTAQGNFIDIREVTGASGKGASVGPAFNVWRGASLSTQINYDDINFASRNEPNKQGAGLGVTLALLQNLTPRVMFAVSGAQRQAYDLYQAGINWLVIASANSQLNAGGYIARLHSSLLPVSNQLIIGVNLAYRWDGPTATSNSDDLVNWSTITSAHAPAVFAMLDQKLVSP